MVEVPSDLAQALRRDAEAWAAFESLSAEDQGHLIELIVKARNADHRRQRIEWIVSSMSGPFLLLVGATFAASAF